MTDLALDAAMDALADSEPTTYLCDDPKLQAPVAEGVQPPGTIQRRRYLAVYSDDGCRLTTDDPMAPLVGSSIVGSDMHAPALDIDVPAYLVPSSTPGHSHLYIDVPMTWEQYVRLMEVLASVGVVETGYVNASVLRGASMLRRPGVTKSPPSGDQLVDN